MTLRTLRALPVVLAISAAVLAIPQAANADSTATTTCSTEATPLLHAHSHNDYERDVPLCDALSHGFNSVEADVWLLGGSLLVGHTAADATSRNKTLQEEYLNPLRDLISSQGSVYPGSMVPFQLVIELKGGDQVTSSCVDNTGTERTDLDNIALWGKVHSALTPLDNAGILSTYDHGVVQERALKVVYSGDTPRPCVAGIDPRPEFFDGSVNDPYTPAQMPIVNAQWEDVSDHLSDFVKSVHAQGEQVRIWFNDHDNDTETSWQQEINAGVDFIGSDHLTRLDDTLRPRDAGYGYVSVPGAGADVILDVSGGVLGVQARVYDTTPRNTDCANLAVAFVVNGTVTGTQETIHTCDSDGRLWALPLFFEGVEITVFTDSGASATQQFTL